MLTTPVALHAPTVSGINATDKTDGPLRWLIRVRSLYASAKLTLINTQKIVCLRGRDCLLHFKKMFWLGQERYILLTIRFLAYFCISSEISLSLMTDSSASGLLTVAFFIQACCSWTRVSIQFGRDLSILCRFRNFKSRHLNTFKTCKWRDFKRATRNSAK